MSLLAALVSALISPFCSRASLVAENLALRQQLAVLRRAAPRPRLRPVDRAFWVVLSRAWSRWADTLVVVKPETVIGWHRRGFVRFWARRSRGAGRPRSIRSWCASLARTRRGAGAGSRASSPSWGTSSARIRSRGTCRDARKSHVRPRRGGGCFVRNHLPGTLAIDFITVPTATFGVLYVFFVLSLERRRVLHVNVRAHPHAAWAAQQGVVPPAVELRVGAAARLSLRDLLRLRQRRRREGA